MLFNLFLFIYLFYIQLPLLYPYTSLVFTSPGSFICLPYLSYSCVCIALFTSLFICLFSEIYDGIYLKG